MLGGRFTTRYPLALAALLLAGVAWAQSPFSGTWRGSIFVPNAELEVIVTLDMEADPPAGTIDIPAQGVAGFALQRVALTEGGVTFAIAGVPGDPTFNGALQDGRMVGTFSQGGVTFPFALEPATPGEGEAAGEGEGTGEGVYTDPAGLYTVPVPTNWTAEAREGYSVLTSPGGAIEVFIVTVPTADVEAALAQAWELVDPSFEAEAGQTLTPPAPAGIDALRVVTYDTPPDQVVQAAVRVVGETAFVMLFRGPLAAIAERQSQVVIIDTGFRIVGLVEEDLTGREARSLTPELVAELEGFIAHAMELAEVPGLAVAVVQDGEVVYANGFGVRELGGEEPVTPETLMMIGSTGKTMTTMMIATLVDEGLLGWDTPVVDVLPRFRFADPELTQQITVRHLMCACTGVPRRDLEMVFNADGLTAEDVVESLAAFRLFTGLGEAFQYSNQMVATGGYVAAAADGAAHGELFAGWLGSMRRRVFDPIGMDATLVRFEDVQARADVATPHGLFIDGSYRPIDVQLERFVLPVAPAGAPWSNALDMGRYLVTLLNLGVAPDGTRVVSEESLRATWEPQVPVSAAVSYALGWMVGDYKGLPYVSHGGNTFGFTSELAFLPTAGVGVSVLANARATNVVNQAIVARLLELLYDLEPEAPAQLEFAVQAMREAVAASGEPAELDVAAVEPFLGSYRSATLGDLELRLEDGVLVADAGEFASELQPQAGEGLVFLAATPPFTGLEHALEVRDGGQAVVIRQGGEEYVFERP